LKFEGLGENAEAHSALLMFVGGYPSLRLGLIPLVTIEQVALNVPGAALSLAVVAGYAFREFAIEICSPAGLEVPRILYDNMNEILS